MQHISATDFAKILKLTNKRILVVSTTVSSIDISPQIFQHLRAFHFTKCQAKTCVHRQGIYVTKMHGRRRVEVGNEGGSALLQHYCR